LRDSFAVYNDPDVILAQTQAGGAQNQTFSQSVVDGAVASIGGATGNVIVVTTSSASGFSVAASGAPGTLTLSVTIANAATARSGLGIDAIATKKSNLTATIAPAVGNDSTQGYDAGSFWMGTTLGAAYVCLDASVGAAVWSKITP